MTGATQMMKAMHKISLSFTSESQRIAVMKRKGKEKKKTASFYPVVFIRKLKDRIVQGQYASVHQKFLERKGGTNQLIHF